MLDQRNGIYFNIHAHLLHKKQDNFFVLQTMLKKSNTTPYAQWDQISKGVHLILELRHPQWIVSTGAISKQNSSPWEERWGGKLWENKDIHAGMGQHFKIVMNFSRPETEVGFQQAFQKLLAKPWRFYSSSTVENDTRKTGWQQEMCAARQRSRGLSPMCSLTATVWLPSQKAVFPNFLAQAENS